MPKDTLRVSEQFLFVLKTQWFCAKVKRLSVHATLPYRATAHSAGYDLSSAQDTTIPARGKALVKTDISLNIPEGHYGRVGMGDCVVGLSMC